MRNRHSESSILSERANLRLPFLSFVARLFLYLRELSNWQCSAFRLVEALHILPSSGPPSPNSSAGAVSLGIAVNEEHYDNQIRHFSPRLWEIPSPSVHVWFLVLRL